MHISINKANYPKAQKGIFDLTWISSTKNRAILARFNDFLREVEPYETELNNSF